MNSTARSRVLFSCTKSTCGLLSLPDTSSTRHLRAPAASAVASRTTICSPTPSPISLRASSAPLTVSTKRTAIAPTIPPRSTRTSTGNRSRTNARAGAAVATIAPSPMRALDPSATVKIRTESRSSNRNVSGETATADRPSLNTSTPLSGLPALRVNACRSAASISVRSPSAAPSASATFVPTTASENAPPLKPTKSISLLSAI